MHGDVTHRYCVCQMQCAIVPKTATWHSNEIKFKPEEFDKKLIYYLNF